MVKNRGCLIILNVPHLRRKINKTCANRPLSCVNGENPSGRMPFGSPFGRAGAERLRGQGRRRRGIGAAIASLCQRDSLSLHGGSRETGLPSPSSRARCPLSHGERLFCAFLLKKLPKSTFYWTFILLYFGQNKKTQEGRGMKDIELRYVGGHVEVYTEAGAFLFSADTLREAMEELDAA